MNLIIDIGNTSIKLAVFDQNDKLLQTQRSNNQSVLKDIEQLLSAYPVSHAMISNVGKPLPNLDSFLTQHRIKYWHLHAGLKLPYSIDYKTPETIGADRLALVAGAVKNSPNTNQLVIDAGTCVTYDFIDQNNIYYGGAISPGLQLRFKALNDYTANLPHLKPPTELVDLIGKDTKTAIQSGVIWGLVNEVEGFIVKYSLKFKPLTVYLTGGDEKLLDRYIKNKIFVNSKFLLLEGINYILNLNK
jgi:type III pantothenate kinase